MSKDWYYVAAGDRKGPVSTHELKDKNGKHAAADNTIGFN
jgi:hypothetical protein